MINELKDAIDMADFTNNNKAKNILLKVASMPENKQADTLKLIRLMLGENQNCPCGNVTCEGSICSLEEKE